MINFKLGPLEFSYHEETWSFSNKPLGYPTLHLFLGSAVPYRSIRMQPGETVNDAKELACNIAAETFGCWLKEAADMREGLTKTPACGRI